MSVYRNVTTGEQVNAWQVEAENLIIVAATIRYLGGAAYVTAGETLDDEAEIIGPYLTLTGAEAFPGDWIVNEKPREFRVLTDEDFRVLYGTEGVMWVL